jgi:hypothetical protein
MKPSPKRGGTTHSFRGSEFSTKSYCANSFHVLGLCTSTDRRRLRYQHRISHYGTRATGRYGLWPHWKLFYHTTLRCDVGIWLVSFKIYILNIASSFLGYFWNQDSEPSFCSCCNPPRTGTYMNMKMPHKRRATAALGPCIISELKIF